MTDAQKERWLRFYFDERHGYSQGEELVALIEGVRDEALEAAAIAVETRRFVRGESNRQWLLASEIRALKGAK